MADQKTYDIVIIGAGPGGYVTAIRAAQLGFRTAVVEANHLGGICLNWGCIPTKALLRTAEVYRNILHAEEFGLSVQGVSYDTAKVVKRSRAVADQLSKGVAHLLKKNKVDVFDGWGRLAGGKEGARKVAVEKDGKAVADLTAQHVVLATGARARELPNLEIDGDRVWSYREAMVPESMPKSVVVVGSGAIGIEFASFYRTMGAEVTVVEVMDRILPVEDPEISAAARKSFEKQGMTILTEASVESVETRKDGVSATVKTKKGTETIAAERIVSAVGIVGNTEGLGLEEAGVRVEKTHVVVDEYSGTGVPGLYAIGDLTGPPWLAHKAEHEGVVCIEKIAGVEGVHPLDVDRIPGCTYCHPQVASVGLTEPQATEQGYAVKVGRFSFIGNGKAIALGEPEGLVKTVFDGKTGELLGAHMLGAEVTELIQGYGIAKTLETTEQELMHSVFPHPTLSEMMHEAVLDAYDRVIHM